MTMGARNRGFPLKRAIYTTTNKEATFSGGLFCLYPFEIIMKLLISSFKLFNIVCGTDIKRS